MERKSKYDIGMSVYLVIGNKIVEKLVNGVYVDVDEQSTKITYTLNGNDIKYDESVLYSTKEELKGDLLK